MTELKKDDIHYIVYYNDGTIESRNSLSNLFRLDIKLILRRTFIKHSSGQGLFRYFKNEILDAKLKPKKNNDFNWNGLKCKIVMDEHWGEVVPGYSTTSVILFIEVIDHAKRSNVLIFDMAKTTSFESIKNDLNSIDRIGTHQGFFEVKTLKKHISKLESKLAVK